MSLLDTVESPKERPVICTICGDSGMGKTSLAATFPGGIFIRAEDGLQGIGKDNDINAFPVLNSVDDIQDQIVALIKEEHNYKTLVIDSVTKLESMIIDDIVKKDPKNPATINQALGGYGAGLAAVAAKHYSIRKACGILSKKRNMNIVFIAHTDTEMIELPDQDPYMRYSLRLGKRSMSAYVDESDVVGFIKLETFVKATDGEKTKAISDGTRVLVTYATAANVSKNRYGITEDIVFKQNENPLKQYIKFLNEA